ncbi:MAG: caspase family protein [Saprospiraceae bacterium]
MISKFHYQISWIHLFKDWNIVCCLPIVLLLGASGICAQTKGVVQANKQVENKLTNTYAVIVGISDYQNPLIPDLKFADKDAISFAQYLQSAPAGAIKQDHMRLLLNDQATMAHFAVALDWLWEVCKPGDQAIIYFSGHGDVERRSLTQPGFLLCWDSPANVYMSGGAFSLFMLQEIISTLSVKNQTQTIAIIDACRSGKLAGSAINGSQLTNTNLAKQYANEIKILSCQPDEYSMEGEQWGGGRGAFSYHLIKGLYGLADENEDLEINSYELSRYLEDRVKKDVAPIRQIPMVIGPRDYILSKVFIKDLDSINSIKTFDQVLFSGIDPRSIDYLVENSTDPLLYESYQNFKKSLIEKRYLSPDANCTESYYSQLLASEKLKSLHSTFTRNYAAALQDEAQQFINGILQTDIKELSQNRKVRIEKSKIIRLYLERSIQLLGNKHYLYETLVSRLEYFKAFELLHQSNNQNTELGLQINSYLRNALTHQNEMPLYYYSLGHNYALHLKNLDSCVFYFKKAMQMAPNWLLPRILLPNFLSNNFNNDSLALIYYKELLHLFPESSPALNALGLYYSFKKEFKESEHYLLKAYQVDSSYIDPMINLLSHFTAIGDYQLALQWGEKALSKDTMRSLTYTNIGVVYYRLKQFNQAEYNFLKSIQRDSLFVIPYIQLGNLYIQMKKFKDAESILNKGMLLDPKNSYIHLNLGNASYFSSKMDQALTHWKISSQNSQIDHRASFNLACVYSSEKNFDQAYQYLERAIQQGAPYNELINDSDLALLKIETMRWESLLQNYYNPDGTRRLAK